MGSNPAQLRLRWNYGRIDCYNLHFGVYLVHCVSGQNVFRMGENTMRSMTQDAGYMALDELTKGRCTVIMGQSSMACAIFEMGKPPEGIKLMFFEQDYHEFPKCFDTLITICIDDGPDNADKALEMLRKSNAPKWVRMERYKDGEPVPDVTLEGDEIWQ